MAAKARWTKGLRAGSRGVLQNVVRSLLAAFPLDTLNSWKCGPCHMLGGFDHPFQSLVVSDRAVPINSNCYTPDKDALNLTPVDVH